MDVEGRVDDRWMDGWMAWVLVEEIIRLRQ